MGGLLAAGTDVLMQLPSSDLLPLQLCRELVSLSVCGEAITDLEFVSDRTAFASNTELLKPFVAITPE